MKVLVFAGSTRAQSFNRRLARVAAGIARERGAEVTHLELGDYDVPMYNADLEAKGTPADVMKLKQVFHEHPAWIVCTPEYNASYPALVKNVVPKPVPVPLLAEILRRLVGEGVPVPLKAAGRGMPERVAC